MSDICLNNGNHDGTGNKTPDICLNNADHNGAADSTVKVGPDQLFVESPPKPVKRAFESSLGFSTDTDSPTLSPTPFHDDLMGNIHIYTLWMRKFAKKNAAEQEWQKFRKNAINQYDAFDRRLKQIENDVNNDEDSDQFLDISSILQKKEDIEAIYTQIDQYDVEFTEVCKMFEQFSQYLPKEDHRKKVDAMVANLRERYFNVLQQLNRRKEILRWIIPRLQRYKSSGSEIKIWLDSAESRSESFITNYSDILHNEEIIEQIVEELNKKKNVYEDFLAAGKGILGIDHQMQMDELQQDIEDVVQRWDLLCSNMESCLDKVAEEKKTAAIANKSETEKIDIKIEDENQVCTCFTPFKIVKVGDGKYTFGTSKTIRLLRIHGQSIVVRVGGGWEYLYNFLLKVDPCRAKQLATTPNSKRVDAIQLSGISLTPLDNQNSSFTMSVKRMRKSSLALPRKTSSAGSFVSTSSVDELDSCGESLDSLSLSETSSTSSVPRETRSKSGSTFDSFSKTSTHKSNGFCGRKYSHTDSKLYKSTENIHRKKSDTPRMSLMDRQSLYAQKRHSLVQSSSVLHI